MRIYLTNPSPQSSEITLLLSRQDRMTDDSTSCMAGHDAMHSHGEKLIGHGTLCGGRGRMVPCKRLHPWTKSVRLPAAV